VADHERVRSLSDCKIPYIVSIISTLVSVRSIPDDRKRKSIKASIPQLRNLRMADELTNVDVMFAGRMN
jgi:hypothetical protein